MTTADHRHDTDAGYEQDPTEYDPSRVSGGYGEAHGATAADGEQHLDETGERSHADLTTEHTADHTTDHTADRTADMESTDTQDMSNRLDGTDSYGATDDGTDRHEGGYAARHADDHTDDSASSLDGSGQRTVDVGSDTAGEHVGDGTPAVATGTAAGSSGTAGSDLERLVPASRVEEYTSRWDSVKGEFVDEPRQAVAKADKLVGELLDELDQLFRKQRSDLEHGLDADETSTEDLRLALRKYRSFFDRLLAL
jgi:hypothetical protein